MLRDGVSDLRKDTSWKVSDFEELLKTRTTEMYVETSIEAGTRQFAHDLQQIKLETNRRIDKLHGAIYNDAGGPGAGGMPLGHTEAGCMEETTTRITVTNQMETGKRHARSNSGN